jgi:hypothetical protein
VTATTGGAAAVLRSRRTLRSGRTCRLPFLKVGYSRIAWHM